MRGSTSKSVLLLDISRLIWRARRRGPTGIDRVELAYAEHFIAGTSARPVYGVLHLFGFLFAVSPNGARRFVEELAARWRSGAPTSFVGNLTSITRIYVHLATSLWFVGPWLRQKLRAHGGAPVFLVVSHHHVARGGTIERIRCTLGVKTACFLHDLIPLEYPEYFQPGWEQKYQRLAHNLGRLFDAVIANSETTARALKSCLHSEPDNSLERVAIRVTAPGVRKLHAPHSVQTPPAAPYFVVLGTIEPRKNHLLLLNLWARLASTMPTPPRLLVIGARGWENEQVVDMLERSRRLRGVVEERRGLSDSEVDALLASAQALLLPSFAEGFGLPLAEALAAGVPVICSDIPVFRELGREVPEYLDPLDVHAWTESILEYARPDSVKRAAQLERLAHWQAPRWSDHFGVVEQLLGDLDASRPLLPAPSIAETEVASASNTLGSP